MPITSNNPLTRAQAAPDLFLHSTGFSLSPSLYTLGGASELALSALGGDSLRISQ